MSDLAKNVEGKARIMENWYRKLERINPDSPLLKLAHREGLEGWVWTNEFWARYPADVYETMAEACQSYAEDLEEAHWKATHAFD